MRSLCIASIVVIGCAGTPAPPPPDTPPPAITSASASASAAPPVATTEPAAPPLPTSTVAAIDEAANGAMARGEIPGAVIAIVHGGRTVFEKAYGLRLRDPSTVPLTADSVFDLASLSKAVVTAPCVHLLAQRGLIDLGAPVSRYLPAFGKNGKEGITVEQLLLHTSGLIADNALADYRHGRADALARIDAQKPTTTPGSAFAYSDVGYIVLGELVEKVSGKPLDVFARESFFGPLGMRDTTYNPDPALAARAAPTEARDGAMLQGVVHDPRAHLLGGVAGHAGVFSTVGDLARFANMLLHEGKHEAAEILPVAAVRAMTKPREVPGGAQRSLGWDVQSSFSGARGELGGYGHTGFTGTSLWIDPGLDVAVIVLTSRMYPDGKGDPRRVRREVATAVARGLREPAAAKQPARVLTGIDVLEKNGFAPLRGKHVALVTNPSGVDGAGASSIDVLRAAPGVTVVALFSPEHGIRGVADGSVGDGIDAKSGLPVYSLYGKRTKPTDEQLKGVDALVFDLADAGARFYTFETTLGYMLETAAAHRLPIVVLDRPDPIGGLAVEGPLLDAKRTSFVGYHPLPVRHGMTLGELAQLFNKERSIGADLTVVRAEGWRRGDYLDETGLAWVNPSPNLRSVDEALLYPGVALLEATNVSVGRGTPRPFEQIGAPWMNGSKLAQEMTAQHLPGVRFTATSFTPDASVFSGERCEGVLLTVEDRAHFEPVRTGVALASALGRLFKGSWQPKNVMTLLGHQPTFDAILRGDSLDAIVQGWQPELRAFLATRKKYLLYLE